MAELILFVDDEYTSPWAHSVWIALKEKGIPFTLTALDLPAREHKRPDYASGTLAAKIPSLRHGALWLSESFAIGEYLEDAFPPPAYPALLPTDPIPRARDREIRSWLRTSLFELRRCMPYEGIFVDHEAPALTDQAKAEVGELRRVAARRWDGQTPASPTLADFELAMALRRPIHYGQVVDVTLREIADALWFRPSSASWVELDRSE